MENEKIFEPDAMQEAYRYSREPLPPADTFDPVIEAYKTDIDFTLVERNLALTIEQRAEQLLRAVEFMRKFRPLAASAQRQASKS